MRPARGFTLIELLIVVVIIGLLAAIAIPKFASTKEKAYLASMKSDLRNLVTVEEAYFAEHVTYTSDLGTMYSVTAGVHMTIGSVTGGGFAGTATHNGTSTSCTVAIGSAAAGGPEGSVTCN